MHSGYMWVQQAVDARGFAARARPRLDRYPVESNVLATWLQAELDGKARARTRWWLVSDDAGALIGVGFQVEGYPLQLAPMPPEATGALAAHYAQTGLDLTGVTGIDEAARDFAQAWQRITGAGYRATMAMRIYALSSVADLEVPGAARLAGPDDADLCHTWLTAFGSEATPDERRDSLQPMVERRVRHQELWLWEYGGRPVSLAGVTAPVAGVARVAPVYTPPVFRRRGFGAAAAAAASRAGLAGGAGRCMLYTDLANPVSNSIYPRLGYRAVADAVRYSFSPAPTTGSIPLPIQLPTTGSIPLPATLPAGLPGTGPIPLPPSSGTPHFPTPPAGGAGTRHGVPHQADPPPD